MLFQSHRGRLVATRWVFGINPRGCGAGPIFYVVPKRDSNTLLPIIQYHVQANSTVISDEWRAYGALRRLGYVHMTVNHSRNFINPVTGNCTWFTLDQL